MRFRLPLLVVLAAPLFAVPLLACDGGEKKDILAYPDSYQPQTADLTFNKERLTAFNALSEDKREAFVAELEGQAGAFKGQAVLVAGNGLGETVEDFQHGEYEVIAHTPDPVLYEIQIEYKIFTTREMGKALHPHRPLEFKGTLIGLRYEAESKPRKLYVRVKADEIATLTK
ncbi:MAG: hypothetical protein KC468_26560 [Myxococcales bacterium]|nr:hypothetical protein [Myxococcales bacterium]